MDYLWALWGRTAKHTRAVVPCSPRPTNPRPAPVSLPPHDYHKVAATNAAARELGAFPSPAAGGGGDDEEEEGGAPPTGLPFPLTAASVASSVAPSKVWAPLWAVLQASRVSESFRLARVFGSSKFH